jgi:hypothetical protein
MKATPIGTLTGFVAIEKPSTKFDDNGVYSCQVSFTGKDAKEMKETIDAYMEESKTNSKKVSRMANPPYTIEGKTLVVKFKQKARILSRSGDFYEKEVKLFDAKNNPVEEQLFLGEGSAVRVAYKPYLWGVAALGCGCTLQLEMVQVIDLVKRQSGGEANPFGEEEGFVAAKKDVNPFETAEAEDAVDEEPAGEDNGDF